MIRRDLSFVDTLKHKEKLSEEALAEKMARIREQNARIKERRIVSAFVIFG